MNEVRKRINEVLKGMNEIEYSVNCRATSGGFTVLIGLEVEGLEDELTNKKVLLQIREQAILKTAEAMDAYAFDRAMDQMDYPDECKAWAIAVLWFALSSDGTKENQRRWRVVFDKWDELYSNDYTNKVERNKLLVELGLNEGWVKKQRFSRNALAVKLSRVGKREKFCGSFAR